MQNDRASFKKVADNALLVRVVARSTGILHAARKLKNFQALCNAIIVAAFIEVR